MFVFDKNANCRAAKNTKSEKLIANRSLIKILNCEKVKKSQQEVFVAENTTKNLKINIFGK